MEDTAWMDVSRDREVPVRIYAPNLEHGEGPFPLVVFSHGGGESREAFGYLGTYWARCGYITVFLTHAGSDRKSIEEKGMGTMGGGGIRNFHLRPEDVLFVLDKLLSNNPGSQLIKDRLAADQIAVAGQCAGASTALAMVGLRANLPKNQDATFIDQRFKCAIALSPQPGGGRSSPLHADSWARIKVPTLMITGTRDFKWMPAARANPDLARVPFDGLPPGDKFLVEIKGAEHNAFTDSDPYYPARERDPRHHLWIQQATIAFLDAYMKDNPEAREWLLNEVLEAETKNECMQEQKPIPASGDNDAQTEVPFQDRTARATPSAGRDADIASLGAKEPYNVAVIEELKLHDAQRNKDLTMRITYPESDGPFPIILFAHAVRRKRDDFEPLAEHWAANGYVVLQADHNDTGRMGADWRERARDMSFMIDSLGAIEDRVPMLASRMDARRIGAGGHYIGAYAACAMGGMKGKGFGPGSDMADFMDPRVGALLLLSPQGRGQELNENSWNEIDIPMFVASGSRMPSRRTSNPPEWRTEPYRFANPGDKYLLWMEDMDGSYAGLCSGDIDPESARIVRDVTTAFWDAHLKSDPQALQRLRAWPVTEADRERFRLESKTEISSNPDCGHAMNDPSADDRYDFTGLDQFLEKSLPRLGGGCAFILIQGDSVIHRNAYGTFTTREVVPIASSTKWISGGVIMALVDAGIISLDDPASKYLPYFTGKKAGITVRQMFSHTHGLMGNARDHLYKTSLTMDEAVREIARDNLIADPGTALYYSGLGMQAAARICEIATGKPWADIFDEVLRRPLSMSHTDYWAFGVTSNPNVAGSGRTCVDDYGNYLTMLLNRGLYKGKRILSEKAVTTMLENQSGILPILRHPYEVLDIFDTVLANAPYGIGCWLEDFNPETGQTTSITSGGGFGCMPFLDLKRNVAGVFLPHNRNWKRDSKGRRYNDAHRVYYEARAIINEILDAGPDPNAGVTPGMHGAAIRHSDPPAAQGGNLVMVHGNPAADYSARNGGRSVLVMVDGKIVFERYDNGFGPETETHLHSATKGFWGPVIAAMIEDGLIESFDELAVKTLPEWRDHPRKCRITLCHLLNLNAGLVQDVVNLQGHDRSTLAPDLYQHAIGVPCLREPGTVFQYGPSCYYVLGEIMKRKLASREQTPLDYLKQRILDPIGAQPGDWVHDASGNPHIPNGAHFTAREWVKYGQWLLQGGEWNGKQLISRDLLDELVKPSKTNAGHGLALWLNQPDGQGSRSFQSVPTGVKGGWIYRDGCTDLFAALGAGKCRLYIIPSLNMVALRQGDTRGDRFNDHTFLSLLLGTV
jgi:CubicO group peptidase (beta-lactamase class C family)/predicted dienelactone hydrolase